MLLSCAHAQGMTSYDFCSLKNNVLELEKD